MMVMAVAGCQLQACQAIESVVDVVSPRHQEFTATGRQVDTVLDEQDAHVIKLKSRVCEGVVRGYLRNSYKAPRKEHERNMNGNRVRLANRGSSKYSTPQSESPLNVIAVHRA